MNCCTNCGQTNPAGANLCGYCGTPFPNQQQNQTTPPAKKFAWNTKTISMILVLAVILCAPTLQAFVGILWPIFLIGGVSWCIFVCHKEILEFVRKIPVVVWIAIAILTIMCGGIVGVIKLGIALLPLLIVIAAVVCIIVWRRQIWTGLTNLSKPSIIGIIMAVVVLLIGGIVFTFALFSPFSDSSPSVNMPSTATQQTYGPNLPSQTATHQGTTTQFQTTIPLPTKWKGALRGCGTKQFGRTDDTCEMELTISTQNSNGSFSGEVVEDWHDGKGFAHTSKLTMTVSYPSFQFRTEGSTSLASFSYSGTFSDGIKTITGKVDSTGGAFTLTAL